MGFMMPWNIFPHAATMVLKRHSTLKGATYVEGNTYHASVKNSMHIFKWSGSCQQASQAIAIIKNTLEHFSFAHSEFRTSC